MAQEHIVAEGEYLSGIAAHYGYRDYRVIWNDPANAELKAKRKSPDVLYPGDRLVIPDRTPKTASVSTGQTHRFIVTTVPQPPGVKIIHVAPHFAPGKVIFENGDPHLASAGERCQIDYEVVDPDSRITDARLEIERKKQPGTPIATIPLDVAQRAHGSHTIEWDGRCTAGTRAGKYIDVLHSPYVVRIVATSSEGTSEDGGQETSVLLEALQIERGRYFPDSQPPAPNSNAYYQYQLTRLGYHAGPIDGDIGPKTRKAIKNFQRTHSGLKATGTLDAYTKAYLDAKAPPGSGNDHYQFILNYLGYRCGAVDGLVGKKTRRAVRRYRVVRGLPPGEDLDASTKASLDGEALVALEAKNVLENDTDFTEPHENPFPATGAEKKIFIDCDSAVSPGGMPPGKYALEQQNLIRPHFPVLITPLIKMISGNLALAGDATGPLRIDFKVDTTAPPPDLGLPNPVTRAAAQAIMSKDGGETSTGHHAHENRGGIRNTTAGCYATGKSYDPYEIVVEGSSHFCRCVEKPGHVAHGTAGAYFVPSTIAGDRFALIASVNPEGFDTPLATPLTASTGTMIVWRRYRVSKLWFMDYVPRPHRTTSAAQLGLPPWYEPAFIEFSEPPDTVDPLMIEPRAADDRVIDASLFTAILREAGYSPALLSDAQIQSRHSDGILWPLQPAAVYTPPDQQGYYDAISGEIDAFEERFSKTLRELSYLESYGGLAVLVFDENAPMAGTHGISLITDSSGSPETWAWSVFPSEGTVLLIYDQDTGAVATANGAIDGETLAHEVGHSLWLHHASTRAGSPPHPSDQNAHNQPEWQTCTMSYVSLANFCGRCILKLRGWDETKLA